MKETLETIRREALSALEQTKAAQDLEALRVKYLGKKGELTAVLKQMGRLSAEERSALRGLRDADSRSYRGDIERYMEKGA